jgi:hypothetical protein
VLGDELGEDAVLDAHAGRHDGLHLGQAGDARDHLQRRHDDVGAVGLDSVALLALAGAHAAHVGQHLLGLGDVDGGLAGHLRAGGAQLGDGLEVAAGAHHHVPLAQAQVLAVRLEDAVQVLAHQLLLLAADHPVAVQEGFEDAHRADGQREAEVGLLVLDVRDLEAAAAEVIRSAYSPSTILLRTGHGDQPRLLGAVDGAEREAGLVADTVDEHAPVLGAARRRRDHCAVVLDVSLVHGVGEHAHGLDGLVDD